MATRSRSLYGTEGGIAGQFHIEATTVARQLVVRNASAATAGEVEDPTTTAAPDFMGITMEAVTFSTTQADFDNFPSYRAPSEEGTVAITFDPLQVVRFVVSGAAAAGTALATTAPANILTNDTADATGLTITDTAVGTADMSGGLIIGRTGNNAGVVRRLTAHTNNVSTAVTVPFANTIAANDTFIRVPYSKSTEAVQLTTNFVEANGIIAVGTGAAFAIVNVDFKIDTDEVVIETVSLDHYLNKGD